MSDACSVRLQQAERALRAWQHYASLHPTGETKDEAFWRAAQVTQDYFGATRAPSPSVDLSWVKSYNDGELPVDGKWNLYGPGSRAEPTWQLVFFGSFDTEFDAEKHWFWICDGERKDCWVQFGLMGEVKRG